MRAAEVFYEQTELRSGGAWTALLGLAIMLGLSLCASYGLSAIAGLIQPRLAVVVATEIAVDHTLRDTDVSVVLRLRWIDRHCPHPAGCGAIAQRPKALVDARLSRANANEVCGPEAVVLAPSAVGGKKNLDANSFPVDKTCFSHIPSKGASGSDRDLVAAVAALAAEVRVLNERVNGQGERLSLVTTRVEGLAAWVANLAQQITVLTAKISTSSWSGHLVLHGPLFIFGKRPVTEGGKSAGLIGSVVFGHDCPPRSKAVDGQRRCRHHDMRDDWFGEPSHQALERIRIGLLQALAKSPRHVRICVLGRTDASGTPEYNEKLAQRRGGEVAAWLRAAMRSAEDAAASSVVEWGIGHSGTTVPRPHDPNERRADVFLFVAEDAVALSAQLTGHPCSRAVPLVRSADRGADPVPAPHQ